MKVPRTIGRLMLHFFVLLMFFIVGGIILDAIIFGFVSMIKDAWNSQ